MAGESKSRSRLLDWAACVGFLSTVGAFFPGVMSPDSLDQLRQAEAWRYSTTQPPIMTLLWSVLNIIVAGPALMLLLQAAMWWGGWLLVVRRAVPARPASQAAVLLAIGLWPPLFAMTGTVWRDVHMTLALLVAVGLLLQDPSVGRERMRLVFAGLLVAYASAVRINAIFSVLPLASWIAFRAWRALSSTSPGAASLPRRFAIPLGAALVLGMALAGRVVNPALASRMWYPVQNLQVFDLVGISARTGENLVPPALRNGNDAPERIASFYSAFSCFPAYFTPSSADPKLIGSLRLLTTEDDAVLAEIASAWRAAIFAHPGAYLEHRAAVFAANMGWEDLPLHYPYERGVPPNTLGVSWHPSALSTRAYAWFDATLNHASWLWRPWLYLWGSLLVIWGAVAAWRQGVRSPEALLVVASGILYTLPYLFAAPAADLRYHHWPISSMFLSVMLLVWRAGVPSLRRLASGAVPLVATTLLLGWAAYESNIDFGPGAPVSQRASKAVDRGLALLGRGEWHAARDSFQVAAERAPYWWVPETNLGIVARHLGDNTGALAHFTRGVELDRARQGARTWRANFLLDVGQQREALADYTALGGPARADYATAKAAAAAAAALGDGSTASAYAVRCVQLDEAAFGRDVIAIANEFFRRPEHNAQGVLFFQRLARVAPQAWWVHANLGMLAQRSGQLELASQELALGESLKTQSARP